MRPQAKGRSLFTLLLVLVVGAIIGGSLGETFGRFVPILAESTGAGFDLSKVDLAGVLSLGLSIHLKINVMTLIGILAAGWFFRRVL